MKQKNACIAAKILRQTSMTKLKHAANHARLNCDGLVGIKVKKIVYIGKSDVYNMEVADHHNFSVNGGLLIHNCSDAERYGLYSNRNRGEMSVY